MACENCGSNYKGNCNCKDPITLIATGAKGDKGDDGANGTGVSLIDSIINIYTTPNVQTAGFYTLYSYTIDNTPTPQLPKDGDLIKIRGTLRYYLDTDGAMLFRLMVNGNNVFQSFHNTSITGGVTKELDFVTEIKRIAASGVTTVAYQSFFNLGSGTIWITTGTQKLAVIGSNAFNFTQDLEVKVEVNRLAGVGSGSTYFLSEKDVQLVNFVIEKYLLP